MTIKSAHLVGLLALLIGVASAFDSTLKRDFPGPYCALRNTCCTDRHDGCSLPISSKYSSMRSRKDRKTSIKKLICLSKTTFSN